MYVCSSIFAPGAQTAGLIGTGEYSLDAQKRRKDDGIRFRPIGCRCHVQSHKPLKKKSLVQVAGQANGRIQLKLGEPIAPIGGLNPFG